MAKEATLLGEDKGSGQALVSTQGSHASFPQGFGNREQNTWLWNLTHQVSSPRVIPRQPRNLGESSGS